MTRRVMKMAKEKGEMIISMDIYVIETVNSSTSFQRW